MGLATRLLFIEPTRPASIAPVLDAITRRMCAAIRESRPSDYASAGIHTCCCQANSSCTDHILPRGEVTNSLCVHYVAHHRDEVPEHELALVERLDSGEAEPDDQELLGPRHILAGKRAFIQRRLGPARLRLWSAWGLDVEKLAIGLQGGASPSMESLIPARREAEDLMTVLSSVPLQAMAHFRDAVLTTHASIEAWGADALRVSGWTREVWNGPLERMISLPDGDLQDSYRRLMKMALINCVCRGTEEVGADSRTRNGGGTCRG